jgi:hypothetical protein
MDIGIIADFSFRQKLSRSAAGPLCGVPEIIAVPTRDSSVEMIEHADAPTAERTPQPQPLTHDATACPNRRYNNGAAGDQLQIEGARIEPH